MKSEKEILTFLQFCADNYSIDISDKVVQEFLGRGIEKQNICLKCGIDISDTGSESFGCWSCGINQSEALLHHPVELVQIAEGETIDINEPTRDGYILQLTNDMAFAESSEQIYKDALIKIKAIKCSGNHPTTCLSVINDMVIEALKTEK